MKCWVMMVVGVLVTINAQAQVPAPADSLVRYYHPNGTVSSEGHMVDGRPEGYWKSFYATGTLRSEGGRRGALLDSLWRFYAPNGVLESEINYKADKRDGPLRRYDTTGVLVSEETYVEDLREGTARYYHPNGMLHKEIPFKAGKEEGRGTEYAEDGRIVALLQYGAGLLRRRDEINQVDRMGLKQGPWKEFHPTGKVKWEGSFVDDRKQGIFKEYDAKGNLKEMVKYDAGEVDAGAQDKLTVDIKRTFHPNGRVSSLGSYSKSGKKEGLFKEFAVDGSVSGAKIYSGDRLISEGLVNDVGALEGPWVEYFSTGEKRAEGSYKEGKRDGNWNFYHRSGAVEQKGNYLNGLPQGVWKWYYEGGAMHREENYRRGREDGASVEYDPEGAVLTQGEYIDGNKEGPWIYKVGDHTEEGSYKDGLKDGVWKYTYTGGTRNFIGAFVNGEPQGKHRWYWPNGELKMEGKYAAGLAQGDHVHYNEQGFPIMTIKFKDGQELRIDGVKIPPPYVAGGE